MIEVLKKLYDKEQNVQISTFFDTGYTVKLGDKINGFTVEETFDTVEEVLAFLEEQVGD